MAQVADLTRSPANAGPSPTTFPRTTKSSVLLLGMVITAALTNLSCGNDAGLCKEGVRDCKDIHNSTECDPFYQRLAFCFVYVVANPEEFTGDCPETTMVNQIRQLGYQLNPVLCPFSSDYPYKKLCQFYLSRCLRLWLAKEYGYCKKLKTVTCFGEALLGECDESTDENLLKLVGDIKQQKENMDVECLLFGDNRSNETEMATGKAGRKIQGAGLYIVLLEGLQWIIHKTHRLG